MPISQQNEMEHLFDHFLGNDTLERRWYIHPRGDRIEKESKKISIQLN